MVAVIENWSDLVGTVRHISHHDPKRDLTTIAVYVEQVDDVNGYANLSADVNHTTVHITVRDDRRLALEIGDRIRCRTRRARGNRFFAQPGSLEVVTE